MRSFFTTALVCALIGQCCLHALAAQREGPQKATQDVDWQSYQRQQIAAARQQAVIELKECSPRCDL